MADPDSIVESLSTADLFSLLHGDPDPSGSATGYLPGVPEHDVPPLSLVDGPQGVRAGEATAFPAPIALASTWDADLARTVGEALGAEARGKDQDALLAPALNLIRHPQCGRNFEYFSEDPSLTGDIAAAVTRGVQSAGVIATPKHYVANNQETDRTTVSAAVSERALRELYLPGFRACVEAGAGSIMAAYNGVNGTPMTEHRGLLTDVLREEWDFQGFVVSDWWATTDGVAAARAGLDVDMPGVTLLGFAAGQNPLVRWLYDRGITHRLPLARPMQWATRLLFGDISIPTAFGPCQFDRPLRAALADGRIDESLLRENARRVLTAMDDVGMFDGARPAGAVDTADHRRLARTVAERGTVLCREEGVLPLDPGTDVAVIGPNADAAKVGGGGSSEVDPPVETSPLAGIQARFDGRVTFDRGHPPVRETSFTRPSLGRWRTETPRVEDAVAAATDADVAVVFVQDDATEGVDRESVSLPGEQGSLVAAVAATATPTVVVCNVGGPITMPWHDAVEAILVPWYPGQADGAAIARVLAGDVDPSGRLPVTLGRWVGDYPATTPRQFPGVDGTVSYEEGVFVGYRHFDATDTEPLYPFGHGHSYADFDYESLTLADAGLSATVDVTNTADRRGREVVQLYARPPGTVDRPPQALVGASTVVLDAGESRTVDVPIDERALSYYDPDDGWTLEPGAYTLTASHSSRDHRALLSITMPLSN